MGRRSAHRPRMGQTTNTRARDPPATFAHTRNQCHARHGGRRARCTPYGPTAGLNAPPEMPPTDIAPMITTYEIARPGQHGAAIRSKGREWRGGGQTEPESRLPEGANACSRTPAKVAVAARSGVVSRVEHREHQQAREQHLADHCVHRSLGGDGWWQGSRVGHFECVSARLNVPSPPPRTSSVWFLSRWSTLPGLPVWVPKRPHPISPAARAPEHCAAQ